MNGLDLIQALTGVIPGQGANGNGSQGAQAGSGAGLFANLLGQPLTGAALKLQQIPSGVSGLAVGLALGSNGQVAEGSSAGSLDGSPDGASALLQVSAGEAAEGVEGVANDIEGQVLFGLINHAENSKAVENSPVLAAALSEEGDAVTFAAGPNEQNIPAPFQGLSPAPATAGNSGDADTEIVIGQLPVQANATAAQASGKEPAPAALPLSGEELELAIAIAPDGEDISAAVKGIGPAEAPAAPQSTPVRSDVVPVDAQKAAKAEGDSQPRLQVALKVAGEAQAELKGDAESSGNSGRDSNPNGDSDKKSAAALLQAKTTAGPGIKTSLASNPTSAPAFAQAHPELPAPGLQSQMTPLRALENSMALQAGLMLPFDGAAIDPMTGMQTSMSAQSLAGGIQALQAGTSISSPATSAASFAHAPNFVAHQVGLQITKAVADGQNEFTIRLNPPELGRVEVRLEFLADGGVKAALSAEKPETLNLLQRDAAALERALNEAGIKTDTGSLNFSLQQGEAQAGEDSADGTNSMANAGEKIEDDLQSAEEIEITEQVIQQMVADGTVDIRV